MHHFNSRKMKNTRTNNEINAGSMADIAFLLLIFFLVTTIISEDKGLMVKLPPIDENNPVEVDIEKRNLFTVLINKDNQLSVRGEPMALDALRANAKLFIRNPKNDVSLSENPKNALISLMNDRGTNYSAYLHVYNELKAAYQELWNETAQKQYGVTFESLSSSNQKTIKNDIPLVISEADPTDYGERMIIFGWVHIIDR